MSRVGHTAHCIANTYATYFQQVRRRREHASAGKEVGGGVGGARVCGSNECAEAMVWGSKIVMEMGKHDRRVGKGRKQNRRRWGGGGGRHVRKTERRGTEASNHWLPGNIKNDHSKNTYLETCSRHVNDV